MKNMYFSNKKKLDITIVTTQLGKQGCISMIDESFLFMHE